MCAAIITSVSHADVLSLCQEPGGFLGSSRNEKAVQSTGKNSSPVWDNGNVKDILASKGGPSHCRCERKSSDLKTFSSVSVSSTSRQGTPSPTCSHCVHATAASGAVSQELMEPFHLSGTSPMSTCLSPN